MTSERYVALGLAGVRSAWFTDLARWATVGSIPVEFVKCVSAEEVRARLSSGRPFSVLLADSDLGEVDRDLIDVASAHDCATIVVDRGRSVRDWSSLGVAAVLPEHFGRDELIGALEAHTRIIGVADALPAGDGAAPVVTGWRGRLVAITGTGGTGASTVAAALAQGLAADVRYGGLVVLADLALDADQAVLHDARDVVPGVPELVDAHRRGRPSSEAIRALTFSVENRGYHLLLGLRRHRDWTALRARSFEAAIDGLRRSFGLVVADIDPDVEGERQCGSVDVEERNLMARTAASGADLVVVVATGGVKGVHALVRTVNGLREHGVAPERILPVINHGSRHQRSRAELTRAVADLAGAADGTDRAIGPIFLPTRRGIDEVHRDGARFPALFGRPLVGAVQALLDRTPAVEAAATGPVPVEPGSLGTWTDQEAAGQ